MIAAERTKVSALISVSGAGYPIDQIVQEQLKDKLSFELLEESNKIIDSLKMGKTVLDVNQNLLFLFRPAIQPYLISWMQYDPAKEISKLKIPVLIIQCTTDLQVTVDDAKLLSVSKPDAKLMLIDNMNHVLKESDSDIQKNMATYNKPDLPLKPGLVDGMVHFILAEK
jgi:pimeloyl-ACP methyl ester carboxylesterase